MKTVIEIAREGLALAEKSRLLPVPTTGILVDTDNYATLCRKLIEVAEYSGKCGSMVKWCDPGKILDILNAKE